MRLYSFKANNKEASFTDVGDLLHYLKDKNYLLEQEFSWNDVYTAVVDAGYPFHYWVRGAEMTVREWVELSKKETPRLVQGKSNEDIARSIVNKDHLWHKKMG